MSLERNSMLWINLDINKKIFNFISRKNISPTLSSTDSCEKFYFLKHMDFPNEMSLIEANTNSFVESRMMVCFSVR